MRFELELAAVLCSTLLGGEAEARHDFALAEDRSHVRIDCETETHVYEVGLDERSSSYDSVGQALFAAEMTGKEPMIVLVDSNGGEGIYEFRIETAARRAGVPYVVIDLALLRRWQMTAPFRAARDRILSGGGRDGPLTPAGG